MKNKTERNQAGANAMRKDMVAQYVLVHGVCND